MLFFFLDLGILFFYIVYVEDFGICSCCSGEMLFMLDFVFGCESSFNLDFFYRLVLGIDDF